MNAQYEEKDFIRYTVKDGLSDNFITCLQQDDQGYIWIGTDVGLNRFDGNSFKNFYPGMPTLSLLSGTIRDLKLFENHQLGIIGRNGFQLMNTKYLSTQNYFISDSTAFTAVRNATWDAVQLSSQSFAVTTSSGFYVFNKPGDVNFYYDAYSLKDIGKKRILYGREIFRINNNDFLVYTEERGLAFYDARKKLFRDIEPTDKEWKKFLHPTRLADDRWTIKHQLSQTEFIFISHLEDSVVFYDHALKKVVVSPLPFHSFFELSWESKIQKLNDSIYAINGGSYGFYLMHLSRQTGRISFTKEKFLSSYKITCLFFDKDKRLWAGTDEGLLQQKLNPSFISSYRIPPSAGDTLTGGFDCAYRYKNKLYAGRYSLNKGLVVLDPSTMQPEKQIDLYGGHNGWNEIFSMEMYHQDTLWLGTNAGLLWFDTKTDRYGKVLDEKKYPWSANISVILAPANKDGYAWFCSYLGGLVVRYHIASRTFTAFTSGTQPALPFDKVKGIAYDSYGDVWISGHSLTRWNSQEQLFDTLITVYGGKNKFTEDIITMSADNNGSLWLHSAYNDLLEYRIKEKKFIAYTMKDGLPPDELQTFSPVIDNNLWIGSNSHLSKFDTRTKKIIVYDQHSGLPEHKPGGRKIWFDQENNFLYMYAGDYIVKFPSNQKSELDHSGGLLIQELTINSNSAFFHPDNEIKLKYNENNLLLNYTIIDFEKSNYQFAYKLNNAENWNNLGQQRSLNLNNLQPGKYTIELKATGKSGDEKIKEFTLLIKPPFWKTTWFLLALCLLLTGTLYYLYRRRIKQVREKANIDKLLAQTEMKALHSQMNPHFIFNSLNSIREMILNNENKEASHYLSKFAQLIRITLDQSGQSFISLRNTLDYLQRYIEMEKIRNSYFTYSINVDKQLDLDEIVLPPMLIQPFIENAIWHGVSANNKKITINIDFKKESNMLVCIIDDNGVGVEQSMKNSENNNHLHNPVGIANIKNRIRLLNEKHNLQSSIAIADKKNIAGPAETGTLVTLHLPLEMNEE